ncbi:MAG: hypothetical protein RL026_125 [Pseudomonadota bacterium]|jgi:predicted Zn-dependent protease
MSRTTTALRSVVLVLLLAGGAALVALLLRQGGQSPLPSTLAPGFQLLGAPVKLVDRLATRVLPVDALDERELGEVLRRRYDAQRKAGDRDQQYVDALMTRLVKHARRPLVYRAYVVDFGDPNAMALPGGIILVTRPLLHTLGSEAQLAAILAHEMGHIERGHCFDAARLQLLARKLGLRPLGELADFAVQALLRHSYSKTLEGEADEYAWQFMVADDYDPAAEARSFASLRRYGESIGRHEPRHASPLRDYVMSHPPLALREAEYSARAAAWWSTHPRTRRYDGVRNLGARLPRSVSEWPDEWQTVER